MKMTWPMCSGWALRPSASVVDTFSPEPGGVPGVGVGPPVV